jgi:hypothetical protein
LIGFPVLLLCFSALLAAVLSVGAVGDGEFLAALGLAAVALALGGFAYAIFRYLRAREYW